MRGTLRRRWTLDPIERVLWVLAGIAIGMIAAGLIFDAAEPAAPTPMVTDYQLPTR